MFGREIEKNPNGAYPPSTLATCW